MPKASKSNKFRWFLSGVGSVVDLVPNPPVSRTLAQARQAAASARRGRVAKLFLPRISDPSRVVRLMQAAVAGDGKITSAVASRATNSDARQVAESARVEANAG
ncbi:MAG: hypothetical protein K2V38_15725, partial [Gemmataceae bacterium]|nr:hypothetical protein [Gemmataceae bacterium]